MRCAKMFVSGFVGLLLGFTTAPLSSQQLSKFDRDDALQMLRSAAADVQKNYYDPKLHGLDWDAKVQQAKENIAKADTMDSAMAEIAALLDSLNDSHTSFVPPPRNYVHKYGFRLRMVGDRCYVIRVHADSDAEKKGLKVGDQVLAINGLPVSRKILWRIQYVYNHLRPQPGLRLTLAAQSGDPRHLDVMAKLEINHVVKYALHQGVNRMAQDWDEEGRLLEPQYFENGDAFLAIRIPAFAFSAEGVDRIVGKMRKHKGVVLDLRGNPGGFEDMVDRMVGALFQNDVKVYDRVRRNSTRAVSVSGRRHDAFTGKIAVLVDSGSASASELFARIVQLERRGYILGDRTAGMVMEAQSFSHEAFTDSGAFGAYYGVEVTEADLIMSDGKSLEHVGVEPDIMILPTTQDLANKRDPAMAKAAGLVGLRITPEEAGSMFPDKEKNF
jgi:carboxyl-terminal processing protease